MAKPRIHHYAINAPADILAEVVRFYSDVLGLEPGFRPDFGFPGYWLYNDEEPILHLLEDNNRQPGTTAYLDHIALRCEDLAATRSQLDKLGVEYGEMAIAETGQTQLFISDPAGTTVELNFAELA